MTNPRDRRIEWEREPYTLGSTDPDRIREILALMIGSGLGHVIAQFDVGDHAAAYPSVLVIRVQVTPEPITDPSTQEFLGTLPTIRISVTALPTLLPDLG